MYLLTQALSTPQSPLPSCHCSGCSIMAVWPDTTKAQQTNSLTSGDGGRNKRKHSPSLLLNSCQTPSHHRTCYRKAALEFEAVGVSSGRFSQKQKVSAFWQFSPTVSGLFFVIVFVSCWSSKDSCLLQPSLILVIFYFPPFLLVIMMIVHTPKHVHNRNAHNNPLYPTTVRSNWCWNKLWWVFRQLLSLTNLRLCQTNFVGATFESLSNWSLFTSSSSHRLYLYRQRECH